MQRLFASLRYAPSLQAAAFSSSPAPLALPAIQDRIFNILKDFEKVDAKKLTPEAHFIHDLGLDSLDQVEVTLAIEEEFNIEIQDSDADSIYTIKDAAQKVLENGNAM